MEQKFCDWPSYEKNTPNTDTEKTLKKLQNQVISFVITKSFPMCDEAVTFLMIGGRTKVTSASRRETSGSQGSQNKRVGDQ